MEAVALVVGGGLGGSACALALAESGITVVLTEPTRCLGGVMTSQGVPPDEHPWIERFGCTRSYRRLRDGIRAYYRAHYPLTERARRDPELNPGGGHVSSLCFEPRVGAAVLDALLSPHRSAGTIDVRARTTPSRAPSAMTTSSAPVPWTGPRGQLSFLAPDPRSRAIVARAFRPNPRTTRRPAIGCTATWSSTRSSGGSVASATATASRPARSRAASRW